MSHGCHLVHPPYTFTREKRAEGSYRKPVWRRVNHGRMTEEGEALKDTPTVEIREERTPREGGRPPALAFLCFGLPH